MTFSTWLLFLVTEVVLSLTPGPAVLFVFAHGLRYGGRHSLWASIGILSGNAFYFAISATGLSMLVHASHTAFTIVKLGGAAYLVYLGVRMMFSAAENLHGDTSTPAVRGAIIGWRGFVLQVTNPKALIFFTALLPQFVSPGEPIARQMVILGVTSIVSEFFVLAAYGYFAGRLSEWAREPRIARTLNRTAGGVLVACGVSLAVK